MDEINVREEAVQRLTGDERLKVVQLLNNDMAQLTANPKFTYLKGSISVELRGHQFFILLRKDGTTQVLGANADPREALLQAKATCKRLGL